MIDVLVADDDVPIRRAFCALIDSAPDLRVVAEASDGRQAVDRARATVPQVVLMDIRMPVLDGIEATRLVCADPELRRTRVLVLTTFDVDEYVYRSLRAGASGFLLKDVEPAELLHAVRTVSAGDALIAPRVTRRLIARFVAQHDDVMPAPGARPEPGGRPAPGVAPALAVLTDRELDVVRLVARGLSNQELAGRLHISALTAKTHVSHALTKLGCRDRAQLVALAYESGLVVPGEV